MARAAVEDAVGIECQLELGKLALPGVAVSKVPDPQESGPHLSANEDGIQPMNGLLSFRDAACESDRAGRGRAATLGRTLLT